MILGSNLNEDARAQATTGVKDGGLGLRRAVDLALPAFVASCTTSEPLVLHLANALLQLDILPGNFFDVWRASVDNAINSLKSDLLDKYSERVQDATFATASHAEESLQNMLAGKITHLQNFGRYCGRPDCTARIRGSRIRFGGRDKSAADSLWHQR